MSVAYQAWGEVSSGSAMGFKRHMQHQCGGDTAGFKHQQQQEGIVRKLSALSMYMSCQNQLHQQLQPQPLVRDCSADARAACSTVSSPNVVSSPTSSNLSHFSTTQSRPGVSPSKQTFTRDHHSAPVSPSSPMDSFDRLRMERPGTSSACGGFSPFMAARPIPVPVRSREHSCNIPSDCGSRLARDEGASQSQCLPRRKSAGEEVDEDLSSSDSESDNGAEKDEDCMDTEPCLRSSIFPAGAQALSCSPPSVLCLRKGLSRHYGGKSRSFTSLADAANCQAQDLAKPDYGRRRGVDKKLSRLERYRMGPLRTWECGISKPGAHTGCGKSTLALGMSMIREGKSLTSCFGRPGNAQQHGSKGTGTVTEDLRAALGTALSGSCSQRKNLPALQETTLESLKKTQVALEAGN